MEDTSNVQTNFKHTRLLNTLESPQGSNIQGDQGNSGNVHTHAGPSGQPTAATLEDQEDLPSITEKPRFDKITNEEAKNQSCEECKMVFLGAPQVGKSSIIRRFIDEVYNEDVLTQSTFYKMLEKKKVFCKRKKDGKIFKIIVYDIGQDEDLDSVEAAVFDQCQVAIVVFDVTVDRTLKVAKQDMKKVKEKVGNYPMKFLLAGNKCDHDGVDNTIRRGRTLANDNDMPYYVISAKQEGDIEVYKLFEKAIEKAIEAKALHAEEQNTNRNENPPAQRNSSCVLL